MKVTIFYDLCLQVNENKYLITSLTLKAYTIIERQSNKQLL